MTKKTKPARKGVQAKISKQIIGNIGMYYVCYRLSELGLNVMPTAWNARGIDVLAYTPDGKEYVGIQVKTLSKRSPAGLGKNGKSGIMGDIWCIVVRGTTGEPKVFVMPSKVVSAHVEQKGDSSCWLNPKAYDDEQFLEKWNQIVSFKRRKR